MNGPVSDSLGDRVVYEEQLPLGWQVLDDAVVERATHDELNEKVLATIDSLESLPATSAEATAPGAAEYARLEFKLDLLMDLVTQLLSRETPLPAARAVSLGAQTLSFRVAAGEDAPAAGQHLQLDVYLHAEYPKPLLLTGQVTGVTGTPGAQDVAVALDGMGEAVQDQLEKLIFRHHRRQIAQRVKK